MGDVTANRGFDVRGIGDQLNPDVLCILPAVSKIKQKGGCLLNICLNVFFIHPDKVNKNRSLLIRLIIKVPK